jgi:hypothetical protein
LWYRFPYNHAYQEAAMTDFSLYIVMLGVVGLVTLALFTVLLIQYYNKSKPVPRAPAPQRPQVKILWDGGPSVTWIVGRQRYSHPDEVVDPTQRAHLLECVSLLQRMLPPTGTAVHDPDDPPPGKERALSPPSVPEPARPSRPARSTFTYEEELERPLLERLKLSFFGGAPEVEQSTLQEIDRPVMQGFDDLNQHLQEQLARQPDAPPAMIRAGANGLLEIVVAGQVYERVESIPDEGVRQAMREAVRKWERAIQ